MTSEPDIQAEKEKRAAALSSVLAAVLLTGLKLGVGLMTGSLGIKIETVQKIDPVVQEWSIAQANALVTLIDGIVFTPRAIDLTMNMMLRPARSLNLFYDLFNILNLISCSNQYSVFCLNNNQIIYSDGCDQR